ncbi:hypothetical protein GOEFS_035_00790 [Gordonia effusa NBRC 100432]|uniref:Uncharacterized protein n=1 Tax=Gordonia effusa NBRC 100432 TaxID=1077974 RepID=H0QXJ6_9ACTN|nr:hypothetical protein [Gordonia effusa]GAB17547.1 hypothetical protein GOEFS_035_00790 [Gordonia effusa NBRC 100432]
MRSFVSGLAALVAIAAIIVALPSLWIKERVIDPEGFSSTAATMAANPQVQSYMADEIVHQVGNRSNGLVPSAIAKPIASAYTSSPQFRADFVDIAGQEHAWLFNEATPDQQGKAMELDLTDMVNRVVASTGVQVTIPGPITVPITRGAGDGLEAGRYHHVSQQITRIAYTSVVVAIVAALLALLIARRRGTVLAWLGAGAVVSAAVSWGLATLLAHRAKQEVSATDGGARQVAEITIDGVVDNLTQVALVVGGVGLAVVVVGVIARAAFRF